MIKIELQFEVWPRELSDETNRGVKIPQEIAGNVAAVDWLDHHVDAARREIVGGKSNVVAIGRSGALIICFGKAGQHMHARRTDDFGIVCSGSDVFAKVVGAAGKRRQSSLAERNVS